MTRFDRRAWIAAALAAVLAALVAGPFLRQGLDLVDEGRWLLGARLVADGEDLHAALADSGSGLREHGLALWLDTFGESASSLASIRTLGFAVATGAMVGLGATAAGWVGAVAGFLAALVALPLAPAVGVSWIAAAIVVAFGTARRRLRAVLVGVLLAAVFLHDPRTFLTALVPFGFLLAHDAGWRREAGAFGAGLATVWIVAAILASISTLPGTALAATFVDPVVRGLGAVDGLRAVRTAVSGAWLDQPFVGLRATGESFEAGWPAHGALRATSLRLLALAGPLVIVGAVVARARGRARSAATTAAILGATATIALLLRGDVPSLRATAPLVVLGVTVLAGRMRGILPMALAALVCLPLAAEPAWMSLNADRPALTTVDDVALDRARARRLQAMGTALHPRANEPLLVWPELPGVHWLLGTRPASRHLDVPSDPDADRETAEALRERPPRVVLLGFSRATLGHRLQERAPQSWTFLRENYRLRGRLLGGDENLRVLTRAGTEDPSVEGMAHQLPAVELTVSNDRSPALREDFTVGQGFRSGPRDLEGFAFRARTRGVDQPLRMRVSVWEWRGDSYSHLIVSEPVDTVIGGDGQVVFIEFPVEDTADRDLAILIEAIGTPAHEVRLDWRADDDPREPGDLYPQGDAILGLTPVDADLYFLVY